MTSPNVLLTYYTCMVCPIYTKSSNMIIWDIKECHLDKFFEHDLHLLVHYIKWEFVDSQNKAIYSLELNMKT